MPVFSSTAGWELDAGETAYLQISTDDLGIQPIKQKPPRRVKRFCDSVSRHTAKPS